MLTNYTTGALSAIVRLRLSSFRQAHRIIAAGLKGVKRMARGDSEDKTLSWREVLVQHKTLRGIAHGSLLVDFGESGYRNLHLPDGRIRYPGEGLAGNQQPVRGNRILLEALESGCPMRVFRREGTNRWRDLGPYCLEQVEYRLEEAEGRYIYWFTLAPALPDTQNG